LPENANVDRYEITKFVVLMKNSKFLFIMTELLSVLLELILGKIA